MKRPLWVYVFAILALFGLALWVLERAPISPDLKRQIKTILLQALGFTLAAVLIGAGALQLSAPVLLGVGAGTIVLSGALPWLSGLLKHVDDPSKFNVQCGDPGTCGMVIDGSVCLGLEC